MEKIPELVEPGAAFGCQGGPKVYPLIEEEGREAVLVKQLGGQRLGGVFEKLPGIPFHTRSQRQANHQLTPSPGDPPSHRGDSGNTRLSAHDYADLNSRVSPRSSVEANIRLQWSL